MACGRVVHYASVEAQRVPEDMASGTTIRWLIAGEHGARNFYMRLFEMEPGAHIKAHFHPWEHEIFILEGSGRVRIGGEEHEVKAGTAIYIPPNVEHEYWAGPEGMKFLCMIPSGPTAEERREPEKCG